MNTKIEKLIKKKKNEWFIMLLYSFGDRNPELIAKLGVVLDLIIEDIKNEIQVPKVRKKR